MGPPPPLCPEDFLRWSNNVPREMVRLADELDAGAYVTKRRLEMFQSLSRMAHLLDKGSLRYSNMTGTLGRLFRASSMAMGVEPYSFLDLGYVYRRGGRGQMLVAAPLCYPVTLALLDLWREVSDKASTHLVCAGNDGSAFKNLVWDVVLARGFSDDGVKLECNSLGEEPTTEPLRIRLNEYFISTLNYSVDKQTELNVEIAKLLERCRKLGISLLYRCPPRCADVDFFVLRNNGTSIAFQTSISALLDHSSVHTIAAIQERFNVSIERYVFVTVKPEHSQKRKKTPRTLATVRIVDANKWIGV